MRGERIVFEKGNGSVTVNIEEKFLYKTSDYTEIDRDRDHTGLSHI